MEKIYKNAELSNYPLENVKLKELTKKLFLCGRWATKNYYCKHCEREGKPALLKSKQSRLYCEIRYCANSKCLVQRFVRQMLTFENIERFEGLKTLWHFSIGFPIISLEDFKNNFSKIKKRQEYVLNRYFEKLKKKDINIQAVRVLDFSFMKDGKVYLHYHFGAIPISKSKIRDIMLEMKKLSMSMSSKMRNKTTFYLESYGLRNIYGVLSYLSIRASGMYKYDTTKNFDYKETQGDLKQSIIDNKYIFLSNILTKEEYLNSFYNKSHFICIGGLLRPLQGSNITDIFPSECLIHGHLERKEVRLEIIYDSLIKVSVLPPNFIMEKFNSSMIEVIKI